MGRIIIIFDFVSSKVDTTPMLKIILHGSLSQDFVSDLRPPSCVKRAHTSFAVAWLLKVCIVPIEIIIQSKVHLA